MNPSSPKYVLATSPSVVLIDPPPFRSHSPRSPTEFGTGPQHPDFLGIAPQDDQLQELGMFSPVRLSLACLVAVSPSSSSNMASPTLMTAT